MTKRILSNAAILVLLGGLVAVAQTNATFVLKSGQRVSAEVIDMGNDFTVRENGQERRIPISDVSMIDFVGGGNPISAETAAIGGRHLVVLKNNNERVSGRLIDFTGNPLRAVISTDSGQREVNVSELARIYLDQPPGVAGTTGTPNTAASVPAPALASEPGAKAVTVPANARWVDTGINVRAGQVVRFQTAGQVQLSTDPNDVAEASGKGGRFAQGAPLPSAFAGALVGRIGTGNDRLLAIGTSDSLRMPANGRLYLQVNDDELNDNTGQFIVAIKPGAGR